MSPTHVNVPIVDGHLDLAENVTLFGRDLRVSVAELRAREKRVRAQATVTLPELERGGIGVVIATVTGGFKAEDVDLSEVPRAAFYRTPEESEVLALAQLDLYEAWERQGRVRLLKSVGDLEHHLALWQGDSKPGLVLLLEGADPIVRVSDLPRWYRRGVRLVGLTYGDTRYGAGVAGGSASYRQGGLTPAGVALLERMGDLGMTWDISHLTETGVWQGLEQGFMRVCASHANARALIPSDRHLSDEVIRALAERGGVVGLVLYNGFLEPRWRQDRALPVTIAAQVRAQAEHMAALVGWSHIGIGSDLDGGFGLEESPRDLKTIADLAQLGAAVPESVRAQILSENWLDFLQRSLPASS